MPKKATYPVVTSVEFEKILLEALLFNKKDFTLEQLISYYMRNGFVKFDITNLKVVLNSFQSEIFLDAMLVDFNDHEFYWMVYGTDAILVKRT